MKILNLALLAIALSSPAMLAERRIPPAAEESPPPSSSATRDRALFEIGVLMGIVEQGAALGAAPASLIPHLRQIQKHAADSGAVQLPWRAVDALIEDLENTGTTGSRGVHRQIVQLRETLTLQIARTGSGHVVAAGEDSFDCTQSSWEGTWDTTWGELTLVFNDGLFYGTYGPAQHALTGEFDPDEPHLLRGVWKHFGSASPGGIRFEMKAADRFAGGWSGQIPVEGIGSTWNGTRRQTDSEILVTPIGEATIIGAEEAGERTWTQPWLIKNVSADAFWIYGYSADSPFIQIYTLPPGQEDWERRGLGYCGTGAGLHRIAAGDTFTITLSLTEKLARRTIAVEFSRWASPKDEEPVTLRTRPLKMAPPSTSAAPQPDEDEAGRL